MKPSAVKKAHDRLKSKGFSRVHGLLTSSESGSAIIEKSAIHVARFADAEVGNARISAASTFLVDPTVPRSAVADDPRFQQLTNWSAFGRMVTQSVMSESLGIMFEVLSIWSNARLEEAVEELVTWKNRLVSVATAQDFGLTAMLYN